MYGKTVRNSDFEFFDSNNDPFWTGKLATEQLRKTVKAFVAANGNYSADHILNEI